MGGGFPCAAFGGAARRDGAARARRARVPGGDAVREPGGGRGGDRGARPGPELDPYPGLDRDRDALADGSGRASPTPRSPPRRTAPGRCSACSSRASPCATSPARPRADHERYARLFHHMLDPGVWLPPSGYELWTLGTEHGPNEVEQVLDAAGASGTSVRDGTERRTAPRRRRG